MRLFVWALKLFFLPAVVLADTTGGGLPEIRNPNMFLNDAGSTLMLVHISPEKGDSDVIETIDRDGFFDEMHVVGDDFDAEEMDVLFLLMDDGEQARWFAEQIGDGPLGMRYGRYMGMQDFYFDYFESEMPDGGPLHVFAIARDEAPIKAPDTCYALGVMTLVYTGGDIADFDLEDCAKAQP